MHIAIVSISFRRRPCNLRPMASRTLRMARHVAKTRETEKSLVRKRGVCHVHIVNSAPVRIWALARKVFALEPRCAHSWHHLLLSCIRLCRGTDAQNSCVQMWRCQMLVVRATCHEAAHHGAPGVEEPTYEVFHSRSDFEVRKYDDFTLATRKRALPRTRHGLSAADPFSALAIHLLSGADGPNMNMTMPMHIRYNVSSSEPMSVSFLLPPEAWGSRRRGLGPTRAGGFLAPSEFTEVCADRCLRKSYRTSRDEHIPCVARPIPPCMRKSARALAI